MKDFQKNPLQLKSLNHISILCSSLEDSIDFYQNVLGFLPVRRPGSLSIEGAWLIGYGVGIHLLKQKELPSLPKKTEINPLDRHISFQIFGADTSLVDVIYDSLKIKDKKLSSITWLIVCDSMWSVEKRLREMEIRYVSATVEEDGCFVDQLFFHDPDGFMIEICNCDNLPVILLTNDMERHSGLGYGKPLN